MKVLCTSMYEGHRGRSYASTHHRDALVEFLSDGGESRAFEGVGEV